VGLCAELVVEEDLGEGFVGGEEGFGAGHCDGWGMVYWGKYEMGVNGRWKVRGDVVVGERWIMERMVSSGWVVAGSQGGDLSFL